MTAYIAPPRRIPLRLRFGLWISRRVTGEDLLPARLLTWYPRSAVGIGVLESLVARDGGAGEPVGAHDPSPRVPAAGVIMGG